MPACMAPRCQNAPPFGPTCLSCSAWPSDVMAVTGTRSGASASTTKASRSSPRNERQCTRLFSAPAGPQRSLKHSASQPTPSPCPFVRTRTWRLLPTVKCPGAAQCRTCPRTRQSLFCTASQTALPRDCTLSGGRGFARTCASTAPCWQRALACWMSEGGRFGRVGAPLRHSVVS